MTLISCCLHRVEPFASTTQRSTLDQSYKMLKKLVILAVIAVVLYYVNIYMNGCAYKTNVRLDGKVIIVTGANTGIGKETVMDFVARGGKVYLGCRSAERGRAAIEDIVTETGADRESLVLLNLDLSSLASVRAFAHEYKQREQKLDILVNNAGVMWVPYQTTVDGYEMTFATNHLGHYLLTALLADRLVASAPSRVVTVSSLGHRQGNLDFSNLNGETSYNRMSHYGHSKLANIIFSRELARRLKDSGVTSYSLHPGAIITELGRYAPVVNAPVVRDVVFFLLSPFLKDAWHGARTQVYCSLEPGIEGLSGKYFSDCAVKQPQVPQAEDDAVAERLWAVSAEMVKLRPDETIEPLRV